MPKTKKERDDLIKKALEKYAGIVDTNTGAIYIKKVVAGKVTWVRNFLT